MKTNLKALAAAAMFVWASEAGHAGPVGPVTTFTSGTPAVASEVNANFSAVKTAVDDNHSRITTLEGVNAAGRITTLEGANAATRITALESGAASPDVTGNITLVPSTPTAGNILKGTAPFIHNFGLSSTFIGENAGNFTMTGSGLNTAIGVSALQANTTGSGNTASGALALQANTIGTGNTASGRSALLNNTIGTNNTANGLNALHDNIAGIDNTAIGTGALTRTTGDNNIGLGKSAGFFLTTGDNNIHIGHTGNAAPAESNTIRIGFPTVQAATFIAGIRGATTVNADAVAVMVDSAGQLGTFSSSRRVKDDIADMDEASAVLMQLRPVTFHYKSDRNPAGRALQYGLVAEEVAEVAPGLVAHSADGRIETVYYQFLAPMLLNEYQKQQRTIAAQTARIAQLETQSAEIAELKLELGRMARLLAQLERTGMIASAGR